MKEKQGVPYCVSFDTNEIPNKIVGIRVALDKHIFGEQDKVRADLVDHPLYRHLHQYCVDNPPRRKG